MSLEFLGSVKEPCPTLLTITWRLVPCSQRRVKSLSQFCNWTLMLVSKANRGKINRLKTCVPSLAHLFEEAPEGEDTRA